MKFIKGNKIVLAEGTYQGTRGVFVAYKDDENWADLLEENGCVRCHPVGWMKADTSQNLTESKSLIC